MGAGYDFLDPLSHITVSAEIIGETAHRHRHILQQAMQANGYEGVVEEFWHFSHGGQAGREVSEPLDMPITTNLQV
jgi:D-alanyl-D-alanine dipeptidase